MDAENIQVLLVESGVRSERFSLGADERLHLAAFVLGSGELSIEVDMVGPRSSFELDGLFIAKTFCSQKSGVKSQESANAGGKLDDETMRRLGDGANATQTDAGGGRNEPRECQPSALGGVGLKASAKPEKPAALPLDGLITHDSSLMTEYQSPQISVIVNHLAPDCTSRQLVKGIALGNSTLTDGRAAVTGSFNGTIHVAREAQHTDAQQYNRNIIVGDGATITTRPQMEIYADDVRCSHGATIGQLDDEAVFYMRQRGLSEAEARRLLLAGFAHEITNKLSNNKLRDEISSKIDNLLV